MQQGTFNTMDALGKKLSLVLDCTLKLPAFNPSVFVCNHGVAFSMSRLMESGDWSWAKEEHERAKRKH